MRQFRDDDQVQRCAEAMVLGDGIKGFTRANYMDLHLVVRMRFVPCDLLDNVTTLRPIQPNPMSSAIGVVTAGASLS